MTPDQRRLYFRLVDQVCILRGCRTTIQREECRKDIHARAFGRPMSAKEIDHLKMFDQFKAACLAILQPANLNAQLTQVGMERTRLKHAILAAAPVAYWQKISRDRFGAVDLDELTDHQLTQLRNTLHARPAARRRPPHVPATVTPPADMVPF